MLLRLPDNIPGYRLAPIPPKPKVLGSLGENFMIACPWPNCDGTLKISPDLPAGEYWCQCHYCQVALTWATYLEGGRKPHVALVEKGEAKA